jgi:hypothetical protein
MATRQVKPEGRANTRFSVDGDVTTRLLDEAIDLAQSQTGPLPHLLRGEERFEGMRGDVRVHAGAGIGDLDHDVVARRQIRRAARRRGIDHCIARGDLEPSTRRHGVARVHYQVQDRGLELRRVDAARPQVSLKRQRERVGIT